jgi:hypothetical protein
MPARKGIGESLRGRDFDLPIVWYRGLTRRRSRHPEGPHCKMRLTQEKSSPARDGKVTIPISGNTGQKWGSR